MTTNSFKSIGEQTQESIRTHSFSGSYLFQYPLYVKALLQIKIAAARTNAEAGVISSEICESIVNAAHKLIDSAAYDNLFLVDVFQGGGAIGVHNNINESLAILAGLDHQHRLHVNASQSTADVCATAIRMALWRIGQELLVELQKAAQTLSSKVEEFRDQGFMARTCLQDAMPTGFSSFFGAWTTACTRIHAQIGECLDQLLAVNLGGTVIGSGEGAPELYRKQVLHHLSEESSLRLVKRPNFYDAAQHSDDLWNLSASVLSLAHLLMKMSRDIRLLASGPQDGLGELAIPKVIQGSAFFSAKNNPTIAETMIHAACLVSGKHHSIELALSQAELNLNVYEPAIGIWTYESIELLSSAISRFNEHLLKGLRLGKKGRSHV